MNQKKDVQSFLGTTGYYQRFIKDYAKHSCHLTTATKKTAPNVVEWTHMCAEFSYLCHCLCSTSALTLTSHDKFMLQMDESSKGISGVLSVCRNGEELPVAYYTPRS